MAKHVSQRLCKKTFIRQHDQAGCGAACLASVIQYHGGQANLARIRTLSGTTRQGTTLLGLYQAAQKLGFKARAFEAEIDHLEQDASAILHTVNETGAQHYVVLYGRSGDRYVIGDPAEGVRLVDRAEISKIWQSRVMLVVEPDETFTRQAAVRRTKWRWFARLVREDANVLSVALALGAMISVLGLSTAVFSQWLIDDILPNDKRIELLAGLVAVTVLLLGRSVITYARQRLLLSQSRAFNNRIIGVFYETLLSLPQPFFYTRKVGDMIARMNDAGRLQKAVTYVLGDVMIDALVLITSLSFVFLYSRVIGVIAALSLPVFALTTYLFHARVLSEQRRVMVARANNESNYIDSIQGMATIKSGRREGFFSALTRRIYGHFQDRVYELGHVGIRFGMAAEMLSVLFFLGVIAFGSFAVLDGNMLLGEFVAVLQVSGMLIPAAMRIALTNTHLQEARVAFDRLHEITSEPPEQDAARPVSSEAPPALECLEISNLSFRFPGRSLLLRSVSFTLRRGEIAALLGESGSGKSTLIQILQRFYRPDSGDIIVGGTHSWSDIPLAAWRNQIGVVSQQIKLFNATLAENICLGDAGAEIEDVVACCRRYELDRYFSSWPQGYATLLGENGMRVSGGQRQLIALARALYQNPAVLMLDEPTAAMDRRMEIHVLNVLRRLRKDMAILLVTHRIQSARFADRLLVLEDGSVRCVGSPLEAARDDNLFSQSMNDVSLVSMHSR